MLNNSVGTFAVGNLAALCFIGESSGANVSGVVTASGNPVHICFVGCGRKSPESMQRSLLVNGDGAVDVDDLLAVINGWGTCPPQPAPCPGDVNWDLSADVDDLLMVINNWG